MPNTEIDIIIVNDYVVLLIVNDKCPVGSLLYPEVRCSCRI